MPTESVHLPILREMFPQKVNLSVAEAAGLIGWTPASLKNALAPGRRTPLLRSVKIGRLRVVPIVALADFLDERLAASAVPKTPMGRPRKSGGAS